jgi:taurine dioxygenase
LKKQESLKLGITLSVKEGNDITSLNEERLKGLLFKHKVIVVQNQSLSDSELMKFALKFGEIFDSSGQQVLGSKNGKPSSIVIVGNNAPKYKNAMLGHQEVLPHSDHQWVKKPSSISLLYAIDVDYSCEPTKWIDTSQAYSTLPQSVKENISNLQITTFNPFYRPFGEVKAKYVNRSIDIPPGEQISHPLVRTHPETNEKILYMHQAYEMEFKGLPFEKGYSIWKTLNNHIKGIDTIYEHKWKNGDLVLWDNRATLHYRKAFDPKIKRVLKRISIQGEAPF